jgi:hypothetical protein
MDVLQKIFSRVNIKRLSLKRVMEHSKTMVALERLALTPQHTLHRIRVDGGEILLATHPQGCSVVTTVRERAMKAGA